MWCSFQLVSVIITINQIFIYVFVIILHENPASLVSKGVMFPNYWGWNIKDMIFFQELWGYVSGLLSLGVSPSPKSYAFRKLNFKSVRAVSWLIRAIQAVTNATSVSTSQPWRVRYFDQLPSLESIFAECWSPVQRRSNCRIRWISSEGQEDTHRYYEKYDQFTAVFSRGGLVVPG